MGKRNAKRNMAETKEELMRDPQWLDMNYERYYFIPWPDSQYFSNVDDDEVVRVENGVFVSMEWLLEDENDEDGPDYD